MALIYSAPWAATSAYAQQAVPPAVSAANESHNPELHHSTQLMFGSRDAAKASLKWIRSNGDKSLVPHLLTAMRFSRLPRGEFIGTLKHLTGEQDKESWFDWMLWQQANPSIKPHSSYLDFKSTVFYSIDPSFQRFFRPAMQFDIRPEEIVWGGVPVDGIPALDNPTHIKAKDASYLKDDDEVFGVEINGDARAYPLRIMGWHEMFNDVIGGVPVSLAYCTLCNAGIVFDGNDAKLKKLGIKAPLTFGSSGFLYRSNKLMYDRNTDSLWNQFTGKPISGKLRGSGIELNIRPVVITSWKEWKTTNPDTKVLSLDTGHRRDYGSGVVYKKYFSSPELMFPALGGRTLEKEDPNAPQKQQIFGMRLTGGTKAWKLERFDGGQVINDKVALTNVVLIGDTKTRSVRAYERGDYTFENDADSITSSDGTAWKLSEDALTSGNGATLKRLPGHIAYWFAWAGYLGEESL